MGRIWKRGITLVLSCCKPCGKVRRLVLRTVGRLSEGGGACGKDCVKVKRREKQRCRYVISNIERSLSFA